MTACSCSSLGCSKGSLSLGPPRQPCSGDRFVDCQQTSGTSEGHGSYVKDLPNLWQAQRTWILCEDFTKAHSILCTPLVRGLTILNVVGIPR